jgi:hypothetical protein
LNDRVLQTFLKRAFESISAYREQENYIAAYVVTFSVIEDRLRALYVDWYRVNKGEEPKQKQIDGPFTGLVKTLSKDGTISSELAMELIEEAKRRNSLMHSAMWNLDGFTEDVIVNALKIARNINNAGRLGKSMPRKEMAK